MEDFRQSKLDNTGLAVQPEQMLREIIAREPEGFHAYADLGSLLFRLNRPDEAMALFNETISKYPDHVWPLSIKAAVLTAERRADEALDAHMAVLNRAPHRSEEHTSELQSRPHLVCRLLLEKKKKTNKK